MKASTLEGLDFLVQTSVERGEWDELPMILFTREDGPGTLILLKGEGNPAEALPSIAAQIKAGEFPAPVEGATGVILFVEAFALKSGVEDGDDLRAEVAALEEMGRRFSDHPDATEMKGWYAIDSEGQTFRSFERGATEVALPPEEGEAIGRIPNGLKLILEALGV